MVGIWLVNEVMGQCDGTNSRFSYIDEEGKIHFGPAWDFDHGSACWISPGIKEHFYVFKNEWASWYYRKWYPDPILCQMTYDAYWNIARPFIMECVSENGEINTKYALFAEAGTTNDKLWGGYPSKQNPSAISCTTAEDVEVLRTFLISHINWLDEQFQSVETLITAMNKVCPYPCDPNAVGITDIAEQDSQPGTRKVIRDGHLYIIRDGETYSIDGKKYPAGDESKLQREEIAGAQRLQTPAGRNCRSATAPNSSGKKLSKRNGSKLQQEEIADAQWLQTTAGRNC